MWAEVKGRKGYLSSDEIQAEIDTNHLLVITYKDYKV